MNFTCLTVPDTALREPKAFGDLRDFFFEHLNQPTFEAAIDRSVTFAQDNHSVNGKLRGLHFQIQHPQKKLVCAVRAEEFNVAVNLRKSNKKFDLLAGKNLSVVNISQLWALGCFTHGFVELIETTEFLYNPTNYCAPAFQRCTAMNDSVIGTVWPSDLHPQLSAKDQSCLCIAQSEIFA